LFVSFESDFVAKRFELALQATGAVLGRVALALPVRTELAERDLVADDVVVGNEDVMAGCADRFGFTAPAAQLRAARDQNRSHESVVAEIFDQAERTDRDEDERRGDDRGDELPGRYCSRESRRAALAEAKQRLDEQRSSVPEAELPAVEIEIDEQRVVAEGQGRKGWLREGRRQLEQRRERERRSIPRLRADRLVEAKQRLEEAHAVELAANAAFEAHHGNRLRSDGRRFAPRRPLTMPVLAEGARERRRPGLAQG
jgi:hypothetical protein